MLEENIKNSLLDNWKCRLYDIDKRELIKEFNSLLEAAKFTGLNIGSIKHSIRNKSKINKEKNKLNKTITFR